MRVADERNRPWHISGGDPGAKPVNLLKRHGYDYVVLPVVTLRSGDVVADAELPEAIIPRVRMLDCMEVLGA